MRILKKVKVLAMIFVLNVGTVHGDEIKNNLDAVLGFGGQMSNIREMLETYSLLGMNVSFRHPKDRLKASMAEYETLLDTVEKNFPDEFIHNSVAKSRTAWKPVNKALHTALENIGKESMKDNAIFIHGNIRSVIKEMAAMKKYLLEKMSIADSANLNASIEIGASARRLSAHYMMRLWKLNDPTIEKHWKNGVKIYTDSIAILRKSSYNSDAEFKKLLDTCEKRLQYFNIVWDMPDLKTPVLIHKKGKEAFESANAMSETILKNMLK